MSSFSDQTDSTTIRYSGGRAVVATSESFGASIAFYYDNDPGDPFWHVDLSSAIALHMDLQGEISPARPLYMRVFLTSPPHLTEHVSEYSWVVTQPGEFDVPMASLVPGAEFDITNVQGINFDFEDCPPITGCESPPGPRSYSVGPISFVMDDGTPARRASWGQLKTIYR